MKKFIFLLFAVLSVFSLSAQDDLPNPMSPPRLVNDFAGVFDSRQSNNLEYKLRAYHDSTTTQIYVVTVETLNGDAPYDFAARLGNKWRIGQKGDDNGVLILIKPKTGNERGQIFIAPGYGLEALLNDAFCGRVIDNEMLPHLQGDTADYYTATDNAVSVIMERIGGEKFGTSKIEKEKTFAEKVSDWMSKLLFFCCILPGFIILLIISPRFRSVVFFLFGMLLGGGRGGGGRGFGGGGGGRGFGGGGGGRFGGGGAGRGF